jgi:hypothetical protein
MVGISRDDLEIPEHHYRPPTPKVSPDKLSWRKQEESDQQEYGDEWSYAFLDVLAKNVSRSWTTLTLPHFGMTTIQKPYS